MRFFSAFNKAVAVAACGLAVTACGEAALDDTEEVVAEDVDSPYDAFDSIASVKQTVVKRQSIGNCWIYASASWTEALVAQNSTKELNASESYWTYWHWFEQISGGEVDQEIETGGSWATIRYLIARYGMMREADFIPEEATSEMSARQSSALAAINTALKTGALRDRSARYNSQLVRQELDKAWGLSSKVTDQLNKVFGADVGRTLQTASTSTKGTKIVRANALKVKYVNSPGKTAVKKTLADAVSEWREFSFYDRGQSSRREFEKRIQRTLHNKQPVLASWYVDFNALDSTGRFKDVPTSPGRQGGHMTVFDDYQIENVPGFGTLEAGKDETRAAALEAALSDSASMVFIRTKNSWGLSRPDRQFVTPGYHDLYMKYLYGPVTRCPEGKTTGCSGKITPLQDVVLPPGF